jgi:hypothetical protein
MRVAVVAVTTDFELVEICMYMKKFIVGPNDHWTAALSLLYNPPSQFIKAHCRPQVSLNSLKGTEKSFTDSIHGRHYVY